MRNFACFFRSKFDTSSSPSSDTSFFTIAGNFPRRRNLYKFELQSRKWEIISFSTLRRRIRIGKICNPNSGNQSNSGGLGTTTDLRAQDTSTPIILMNVFWICHPPPCQISLKPVYSDSSPTTSPKEFGRANTLRAEEDVWFPVDEGFPDEEWSREEWRRGVTA
ncbi:hypothetical protein RUND412_003713 [Rhizina undulata]